MNKIVIGEDVKADRADIFLAEHLGISRSNLKNRIAELTVNGASVKLSKKISPGDTVSFSLEKSAPVSITPEDVELDIVFEDANVFVINKPAGMVVHPAAGNFSGTMAQGLMYRLLEEDSDFDSDDSRPGIVHRLDKDTSGIIIAAKNTASLEFLSRQFKQRTASKTYLAVINGRPREKSGRIEGMIGRDRNNRKKMTWKTTAGRKAVTDYRVLKSWQEKSFVALYPRTGRTHQLRVHMLSTGTPISGDPVYSRNKSPDGLMLHAYKLRIILPGDDHETEFRAPLPERFKKELMRLSGKG